MTERDQAMANLQAAQKRGLADLKLFIPDAQSVSQEEIFAGMNRIDAAIAAGKCDVSETWMHDQTPMPFGPLMA